jgi:ribonuclease VapC
MIVDTSALVAILLEEPDWLPLAEALSAAASAKLSAASFVELVIVVDRRGTPVLSRKADEFLERLEIRIEPVTERQARIAREAYRDYGRGSGHPANLNFGDCFAYALARDLGEPLLYKGTDFSHTEIRSALA